MFEETVMLIAYY